MKKILIGCWIGFLMTTVSSAERTMLNDKEVMWQTQQAIRDVTAPSAPMNADIDVMYPMPNFNQSGMLSDQDVMWYMQQNLMQEAQPTNHDLQWRSPGYASYQPARYVAAYAPPVYYAAPAPQQHQAFVNWLFGTPRREYAPVDVAEPAPEPVQVAAVIAPQPKFQATPTPVPAPPTPAPETTPPDAARIAAEQRLALLAQATRQAQQDAFRWMGLTIGLGLLTGGVCLYFFWQTGDKEG